MASQLQCPKCKNYKTVPYRQDVDWDWGASFGRLFNELFGGKNMGASFENPTYVQKFSEGKIRAQCDYCGLIFDANTRLNSEPVATHSPNQQTTEERLTELEQLRAKNLVSEEEYKRKREEILQGL